MELGLTTMAIPLSLSPVEPHGLFPLGRIRPVTLVLSFCLEDPPRSILKEDKHYYIGSWPKEQEILIPLTVFLTHFLLCFRKLNFKANNCSDQLNAGQNMRWLLPSEPKMTGEERRIYRLDNWSTCFLKDSENTLDLKLHINHQVQNAWKDHGIKLWKKLVLFFQMAKVSCMKKWANKWKQ